jgi:hypothetical protein
MSDSMASFIAGYTRTIIDALNKVRAAAAASEVSEPPGEVATVAEPGAFDPDMLQIDMKVAEVVGGGTCIFPEPGGELLVNWVVFREARDAAISSAALFKRSGVIYGSATSVKFVADAYECILMRALDPVGQDLYPPLIENRQLTHRDLIKILADSDEARARALKLVVIPEPSSWLGDARTDPIVATIVAGTART